MAARNVRTSLVCLGVLLSGLVPRSLHAEVIPDSFPPGFGGFWFGESAKSAQRKCETFKAEAPDRQRFVRADCFLGGVAFSLSFRPNGKLEAITFAISPPGYNECVRSVLDAVGIKGREEDDDGYESWTVTYSNAKGVSAGAVSCFQTAKGLRMLFLTK